MASFVDTNEPDILARLQEYRSRFAMSLQGVWQSVRGSFDVVMSETWTFCEDGTLTLDDGRVEEEFLWESRGPFQIALAFPCETNDETPMPYHVISYEFAVYEHDAGHQVVLRQAASEGFWLSDAPLGRVDD